MDGKPSVIERAFQLAAAGAHRTVTEIRLALRREGYTGVDAHLGGRGVRDQLRAAMQKAAAGRAPDGEAGL